MKNQKEKISTIRTYVLLRKALYELLTEKPFEKISLTDICTRSMVPRSTFYRYFEDKYDLLHYNLVLFFADARLTPDVIISTDIASLKRFLSILFAHFEKHRADYVKIYQLNRQGVLIETMREFLIRIFTETLTEARKNGAKSVSYTHLDVYKRPHYVPRVPHCVRKHPVLQRPLHAHPRGLLPQIRLRPDAIQAV